MVFDHPQLFIISGGPGAGKTTLIGELGKLGYATVPEVARLIIQEQVRAGGTVLPWADQEAFAHLMLERSIGSLVDVSQAGPIFSDRGIPDVLCYARLIDLADETAMREACRKYRYAQLVFLAPPWKQIYLTDDERKQDFAEAERTYTRMAQVYKEYGYEIIELPLATVSRRAEFVLQTIEALTGRRL